MANVLTRDCCPEMHGEYQQAKQNRTQNCRYKNAHLGVKGWYMRTSVCLCGSLLLCGMAYGQSSEIPKFIVADVHVSPRTSQPVMRGPFYVPGRYELRFATMLDMVRLAYGVDPERVSGGPNWLEMDRYDVFAKPPEKSTP